LPLPVLPTLVIPESGTRCNWNANIRIATKPSHGYGTEYINEVVHKISLLIFDPNLLAASIPSNVPTKIEKAVDVPTKSNVAGTLANIISNTGFVYTKEFPRSPRMTFPT
jgi:hypothetical protein